MLRPPRPARYLSDSSEWKKKMWDSTAPRDGSVACKFGPNKISSVNLSRSMRLFVIDVNCTIVVLGVEAMNGTYPKRWERKVN